MNKTIIMGNLTRDPETTSVGGTSVTKFSIAVNERFKTRDGEQRENTHFFDCEAWGGTGDVVANYFPKGKQILLEGSLQQDTWDDKDGNKRSKVKIRVDRVHFTGRKDDSGNTEPKYARGTAGAGSSGGTAIDHDDLPF